MAIPEFRALLAGTMRNIFQVGGPSGVSLKHSSGVLQVRNAADSAHADATAKSLTVLATNASNGVNLTAPAGLGSSVNLTLPNGVGVSGQFLKTDGSGGLSWAAAQSNADLTEVQAITQASASPVTMFTPPANAILREFWVNVTVAAGGGSPTLSVGVSGTPALYVATGDNDLKSANLYVIPVYASAGGSPAPVIITIVVSGQTFSADIYAIYTNPT